MGETKVKYTHWQMSPVLAQVCEPLRWRGAQGHGGAWALCPDHTLRGWRQELGVNSVSSRVCLMCVARLFWKHFILELCPCGEQVSRWIVTSKNQVSHCWRNNSKSGKEESKPGLWCWVGSEVSVLAHDVTSMHQNMDVWVCIQHPVCRAGPTVAAPGSNLHLWHPALAVHTQFSRKGSQGSWEKWLIPRLWQGISWNWKVRKC